MKRVGVLAVQGAFERHGQVVCSLGHRAVLVRSPAELADLDGMILPGGESSVQLAMLDRLSLSEPLTAFVQSGKPVLATCAGLILAARSVQHPEQRSFGWIDLSVARNAYGRQLDSFEAESDEEAKLPLVFIRAPRILSHGPTVEVLARHRGEPVLVRDGNLTCATFHPELTDDLRVHRAVFGETAAQP